MTLTFARLLPRIGLTASIHALAERHAVWRQRQALKQLDSAALRDLGLTREQAEAEARRGFWDAPVNWRR
ncbi:hypothetical protein CVM52_20375 [Pseudooceanicola lipolyticus]|uniref:YjiS-like domain-containing protein n=1 Tax=Pseudooceanicola lipolyticus TaxID=2029104 RepID=A0A2M8IWA5_9RHOB|nr:DUF1127 domain-containing protein [Pseudooceanicola lipolyticus]PJE34807.1 hypothetical protein CVM52_20375 [Pseudooceanicola lipolyticus]